jgi:hypothetical protein
LSARILFIGTIVTVLVATVPALDVGHHGFDIWDAILGLAIAATKASLVAASSCTSITRRRRFTGSSARVLFS